MNFFLENLSTIIRVLMMPPIAVHGPKPMSQCQMSLYAPGGFDGVLFLRFDAMVATSPRSRFGTGGKFWIWTVGFAIVELYLMRLCI